MEEKKSVTCGQIEAANWNQQVRLRDRAGWELIQKGRERKGLTWDHSWLDTGLLAPFVKKSTYRASFLLAREKGMPMPPRLSVEKDQVL